MPFTYPLHSILTQAGMRPMTTVGTTAELPATGTATLSKYSSGSRGPALTLVLHATAAQANIVLTATRPGCCK